VPERQRRDRPSRVPGALRGVLGRLTSRPRSESTAGSGIWSSARGTFGLDENGEGTRSDSNHDDDDSGGTGPDLTTKANGPDLERLFGSVLSDHGSLNEITFENCRIQTAYWMLFTESIPATDFYSCYWKLKRLKVDATHPEHGGLPPPQRHAAARRDAGRARRGAVRDGRRRVGSRPCATGRPRTSPWTGWSSCPDGPCRIPTHSWAPSARRRPDAPRCDGVRPGRRDLGGAAAGRPSHQHPSPGAHPVRLGGVIRRRSRLGGGAALIVQLDAGQSSDGAVGPLSKAEDPSAAQAQRPGPTHQPLPSVRRAVPTLLYQFDRHDQSSAEAFVDQVRAAQHMISGKRKRPYNLVMSEEVQTCDRPARLL
jgi:hypothetical protein